MNTDQVKTTEIQVKTPDNSREQLLSLNSRGQGLVGRELDAAVAEHILGWYRDGTRPGPLSDWHEPACGGEGRCAPSCGLELPHYSTDRGAAMKVVAEMHKKHDIEMWAGKNGGGWFVCFEPKSFRRAAASGPDLPDVICRAALAVREKNK